MNNVIPFDFHGHSVRVIDIEQDPWFVAKDVAEVLGYAKTENAIARHCKAGTTTPKQGGGLITIIPERDVYRLIMRSKLPEAESFEEWVVGEVLPSIRKTGGYQVAGTALPDFNNPAEAARAWADQHEQALKLKGERDTAISTKAQIGSKREATAMAKASAATRKLHSLEKLVGDNRDWKAVKAIPWLADELEISRAMYQQVGKKLRAISEEMGIEAKEIEDSAYGSIKSYHLNAIGELFKRLQADSGLLAKYRKRKAA